MMPEYLVATMERDWKVQSRSVNSARQHIMRKYKIPFGELCIATTEKPHKVVLGCMCDAKLWKRFQRIARENKVSATLE